MARPRSADYDSKRQAILDSAAVLFAEHGFASTSIAMLSQASGGSKAWIYHYYDRKEAILFDLLDHHVEQLLAAVRMADDAETPAAERLRAVVAALLSAYADADAKHSVLLNDLGRLSGEQQERIRSVERAIVEAVAEVLAAAAPALAQPSPLRKPVTMSLLGMLNWHHRWFRRDGPLGLDDYVELVVTLVLRGLPGVATAEPAGVGDRTVRFQ